MKKISLLILLCVFSSSLYAHSWPLNKVSLKACIKKKKSQVCEYQGSHNDLYIGTCQYVSENKLICVRNKPIKKINSNIIEH